MTNAQRSTSQTRTGTGEFARLACSKSLDSRARRSVGSETNRTARLSCRISGDERSPGRSFCDFVSTFQVLHILGGNACTVEEWANCHINITKKKFIVKTWRSCNESAVRIKGNKPRWKIWLKTKTKRKKKYNNINKKGLAENLVHLHGRSPPRPLRHTAKD